jgi:hypothetical protein
MGPLDLLNHLLNFLAPALWMAVLVTWTARLFMRKKSVAVSFSSQIAINFSTAVGVLVLGLWFFGHDGKMATYAGMVLLSATSQWLMLRAWRA